MRPSSATRRCPTGRELSLSAKTTRHLNNPAEPELPYWREWVAPHGDRDALRLLLRARSGSGESALAQTSVHVCSLSRESGSRKHLERAAVRAEILRGRCRRRTWSWYGGCG